jgi:hypothetical protein
VDKSKKQAKTPEEIKAEEAAIERARKEVLALCNRVPRSVLSGSVQTAQSWKSRAFSAYRLANSKRPKLADLIAARDDLKSAAKVVA